MCLWCVGGVRSKLSERGWIFVSGVGAISHAPSGEHDADGFDVADDVVRERTDLRPAHALVSCPNTPRVASTRIGMTAPTPLGWHRTFLMSRKVDTDTSSPQQPLKTITSAEEMSKRAAIHYRVVCERESCV